VFLSRSEKGGIRSPTAQNRQGGGVGGGGCVCVCVCVVVGGVWARKLPEKKVKFFFSRQRAKFLKIYRFWRSLSDFP